MDANRTRFWMLADQAHWDLVADPGLQYDPDRRCLQLARQRPLEAPDAGEQGEDPAAVRAAALARLARVRQATDVFGHRAYWDEAAQAVMATGALSSATPIFTPSQPPTDLAMGYDGILYLAVGGAVVLQDRRQRWQPARVTAEVFAAERLAPDPAGGVWVLSATPHKLARVHGQPLPDRPGGIYAAETFRPLPENPNPPRLTLLPSAEWPAGEQPVALASSPAGRLAALSWREDDEAAIRCLEADGRWGEPTVLAGARHPYSLAWVSESRLAVLLVEFPGEVPVYPLEPGRRALPVGDFYPLREHDGGPFLHGVAVPPRYPTYTGSTSLHRLSLTAYARRGTAGSGIGPLDSGSGQTVWHRLYLEARLPTGCGIIVHLAASDDPARPLRDVDWHEHRFGQLLAGDQRSSAEADKTGEADEADEADDADEADLEADDEPAANGPPVPHGAWVPYPSEIPHHRGLLPCQRQRDRSGLFTVLIQRSRRRVRRLCGRYLHVRVQLLGDGRSTPELWALRAYAPRFSYLDHYLPALYRETLLGSEADEITADPATGPDFLGRFLDNFEGVLTPLEDRIAQAHLLTDPRTTPDEALAWLGSWIGLAFDPAYPPQRRRTLLQHAPQLFRLRGTCDGLKLALNVCTGGGVDGGEIVVVEDFRLRRTFATILGADLADEDDPLLGGLAASGNSYVGETLFVGDEQQREFLALFAADLDTSPAEAAAVQAFLDRLAHRATVLVHESVAPQDLGLIRRVVELETPAHVLVKVVTASQPLLVGIAALVGVDTYLAQPPRVQPVRTDHSRVGVRDRLLRPASLDPRSESL